MLGLRFCARAFSSCGERGPLFIAVLGPLTIAVSLVAEHRLQTCRLSSCGSRAWLLRGMWDLPGPGLEPVSPALAGRFPTTAPPGKPACQPFDISVFPVLPEDCGDKGIDHSPVSFEALSQGDSKSRCVLNHSPRQLSEVLRERFPPVQECDAGIAWPACEYVLALDCVLFFAFLYYLLCGCSKYFKWVTLFFPSDSKLFLLCKLHNPSGNTC